MNINSKYRNCAAVKQEKDSLELTDLELPTAFC